MPHSLLRIPILTLLSAVVVLPVQAEVASRNRIDPLVEPYIDHGIVVGLSVGVLHQGEQQVFGYGQLGNGDERTPDGKTIYEVGSVSKVFTGVLLADAITRKLVRLDQPAGELLPTHVTMPIFEQRAITLQHLATHVSGLPPIPDNLNLTDMENPYAAYSIEDLYEFLGQHRLTRAPGEKGEYSNLGVGLLGNLLAHRQQMSYDKLVRERIASPLGMVDTTIALDDQQKVRLAPPHTADGTVTSNWDIPAFAGAGAILSSVDDMLIFAKAHLSPPADEIGRAIELAWKEHQSPISDGDFAVGLGWHFARDGRTRWHNGQTGGYHSMLLINRDIDSAIVLLANTATHEVDRLAQDIMQTIAGAEVEPRTFEQPIAVPVEIMRSYVGQYELAGGMIFAVSVDGDGDDAKLMVGLTGQPTFQVYPRSNTEWFYRVVKATLTFQTDDTGKCESVELFQHGVRQTAKRVE